MTTHFDVQHRKARLRKEENIAVETFFQNVFPFVCSWNCCGSKMLLKKKKQSKTRFSPRRIIWLPQQLLGAASNKKTYLSYIEVSNFFLGKVFSFDTSSGSIFVFRVVYKHTL